MIPSPLKSFTVRLPRSQTRSHHRDALHQRHKLFIVHRRLFSVKAVKPAKSATVP